jgi:hypothetical protein
MACGFVLHRLRQSQKTIQVKTTTLPAHISEHIFISQQENRIKKDFFPQQRLAQEKWLNVSNFHKGPDEQQIKSMMELTTPIGSDAEEVVEKKTEAVTHTSQKVIMQMQSAMLEKIASAEESMFILQDVPLFNVTPTLNTLEEFVTVDARLTVLHLERVQCACVYIDAFTRLAATLRKREYIITEERKLASGDLLMVTLIAYRQNIPMLAELTLGDTQEDENKVQESLLEMPVEKIGLAQNPIAFFKRLGTPQIRLEKTQNRE